MTGKPGCKRKVKRARNGDGVTLGAIEWKSLLKRVLTTVSKDSMEAV